MWGYWKDKRGSIHDALVYDYPEILASNMELTVAICNIAAAEAQIDKIMSEMMENDYV